MENIICLELELYKRSKFDESMELYFSDMSNNEIEEELKKEWATLRTRDEYQGILALKTIFDLSQFEEYILFLALGKYVSPSIKYTYSRFQQFEGMYLNLELCMGMYINNHPEQEVYLARGNKSLLEQFILKKPCSLYNHNANIELNERIIIYILNYQEEYWNPYLTISSHKGINTDIYSNISSKLFNYIDKKLNQDSRNTEWIYLYGSKGSGKKQIVNELIYRMGCNVIFVSEEFFTNSNLTIKVADIVREGLLYGGVLCFPEITQEWLQENKEEFFNLKMLCEEYCNVVIVLSKTKESIWTENIEQFFKVEVPIPDMKERFEIWSEISEKFVVSKDVMLREFANKFVMTRGQITEALYKAKELSRFLDKSIIENKELIESCYEVLNPNFGTKAVKIPRKYHWNDLILIENQKEKLKMACNQISYRHKVYEDWGFNKKMAYGVGISMIFTGPPGTGKTMAAQVVADALGLDVYKIELAAVVSKYIGETEKNLDILFEEARKSQVVLLFDEADVLFSKRTDVRDSNDKYSNMEAAFLLQKMEQYNGLSVLSTNFIQNIDEAFKRRMKFLVEFPFPAKEEREMLWRQVVPKEMPLECDLDYKFLAETYELTGSNIYNIVLHAAFLAAAEESKISMRHIIKGIANEYEKSGKILSRDELGIYQKEIYK